MAEGQLEGVVLVVMEGSGLVGDVRNALTRLGLEVVEAATGAAAIEAAASQTLDAAILGAELPDMGGEELCAALLRIHGGVKVLFSSARQSAEAVLRAIRAGACDYVTAPTDGAQVVAAVTRALHAAARQRAAGIERHEREREREEAALLGPRGTFGAVAEDLKLASSVEAPVLISGETGTGKSLAARTIHYWGPKRTRAFVSVNCATLPDNLVEAELFGHQKGAFTGAIAGRRGVFEMAQKGTLLLDEIGEMPIHLQSKLLAVLEDKTIRRVGGESQIPVDARIIAATGADLDAAVDAGLLRMDLYYRLSVIRIHLLPLRERRDDIPVLCEHLLEQIPGGKRYVLEDGEVERLKRYPWPGNVRELRNLLERATIVQQAPTLRPSRLLEAPRRPSGQYTVAAAEPFPRPTPIPGLLPPTAASDGAGAWWAAIEGNGEASEAIPTLEAVQKEHITRTFRAMGGNFTRTANVLGIGLSTLKRRAKAYGLK